MNKKNLFIKQLIIPAIFITLLILAAVYTKFNFEVTSFDDRVMGNAILNNIDITKRIQHFYLIIFILFPLLSFLIMKILNKIIDINENKIINFINTISVLGIINFVLFIVSYFRNNTINITHSVAFLFEVIWLSILFAFCKKKKVNLDFENFQWSLLASVPTSFFISLLIHKFNLNINNSLIWLISYFLSVCITFIISNIKKINMSCLKKYYTIFMLSPIFELIFLETYNILNQYNIIIQNKTIFIFLIYLILFITTILLYLKNKNNNDINFEYKNFYYPIIIIALSLIISSIPLVSIVNTDFFESANHGIGVYEFLKYGKIPLIETFDAHMLGTQLFGILYGFLNQDINGAIFCLYNSYEFVMFYIILFIFFKQFFNKDIAFLTTLFFPLINDSGLKYFALGLLSVLTLINAIKKKKFSSFLIYWFSLAFLCLWRLDIGFAASLSSVLILIYLVIKKKKDFNIKSIILPFFIVILSFLIFYFTVCIIKNINPILRIIEFLKVAMSNINWAYAFIGDGSTLAYTVGYYIMPIFIVGTFLYLIHYTKNKITNKEIILLFLALFYIINFQRALVRHSLVEGNLIFIFGFALIYIPLFIKHIFKFNEKKFWSIYLIFIIFNQLLLSTTTIDYNNLFDSAISKYNNFSIHDEIYTTKKERVLLSDNMKNEYVNLKIVLDYLLTDDETYLDFTNQTLLYALLDKEKPVYVNQSPGLLSGDFSQKLFVEQVKNYTKDVNIVLKAKNKLLSDSIDGITNDYRYYIVSEYIYKNYTPIVIIDDYEIWVKTTNYSKALKTLKKHKIKTIEIKDYIKYDSKTFSLGYIPYIWGKYDNEKIIESTNIINNITLKSEEIFNIDSNINNFNNIYLTLQIDSPYLSNLSIQLYSNNENIGEFIFTIKEGINNYTIRASSMYAWTQSNIDNIVLKSNNEIKINHFNISSENK